MYKNNPYTLALLATESQFSAVRAAENVGYISHDRLTRLVQKASWSDTPALHTLPPGNLVVDDTILNKSHSRTIEGVKKLFSPSKGVFVEGYCLVVFLWQDVTGKSTVLHALVWDPEGPGKNELFRQVVTALSKQGLCPETVLFDAWYASCENLNLLDDLGWVYVTRVRENRLFDGMGLKRTPFKGGRGRVGRLKGVGHRVQVVGCKGRYVATNQLTLLTSRSGWALYAKRWPIETFFRGLKQLFHLERCACRSRRAQLNHLRCCAAAYSYLQETYPHLTLERARREFLRNFRQDPAPLRKAFGLAA